MLRPQKGIYSVKGKALRQHGDYHGGLPSLVCLREEHCAGPHGNVWSQAVVSMCGLTVWSQGVVFL